MYWTLFSRNIKNVLMRRYGKIYTKNAVPKIKQQYKALLKLFPDIGKHTLTDMVNMGIVFLAIWTGTEKRFSTQELTEICRETLEHFKLFFGIINLNKPWAMKKLRRETYNYMKWLSEKGAAYPNKWEGYIDTEIHDKGFCYVFTKCPIRDFCEKYGYLEALPALCAQDYPIYSMMHGVLKREQTLADGKYCDFWIYGDKNGNY